MNAPCPPCPARAFVQGDHEVARTAKHTYSCSCGTTFRWRVVLQYEIVESPHFEDKFTLSDQAWEVRGG